MTQRMTLPTQEDLTKDITARLDMRIKEGVLRHESQAEGVAGLSPGTLRRVRNGDAVTYQTMWRLTRLLDRLDRGEFDDRRVHSHPSTDAA